MCVSLKPPTCTHPPSHSPHTSCPSPIFTTTARWQTGVWDYASKNPGLQTASWFVILICGGLHQPCSQMNDQLHVYHEATQQLASVLPPHLPTFDRRHHYQAGEEGDPRLMRYTSEEGHQVDEQRGVIHLVQGWIQQGQMRKVYSPSEPRIHYIQLDYTGPISLLRRHTHKHRQYVHGAILQTHTGRGRYTCHHV